MIDNAGNQVAIARQADRTTVVVGTSAGASGAIDVRHASGLQMLVPAGAASQTVNVLCCDTFDGTYVPLNDSAAAAVTIAVVASNAYDLPEAVFSAHFLKFTTTTAFTATMLAKG